MLVSPHNAGRRLRQVRGALVQARTELRAAVPASDLDHDGLSESPERLAVCRALLAVETAVSELSACLGDVKRQALEADAKRAAEGAA